eukprot:gene14486-biopygen3600
MGGRHGPCLPPPPCKATLSADGSAGAGRRSGGSTPCSLRPAGGQARWNSIVRPAEAEVLPTSPTSAGRTILFHLACPPAGRSEQGVEPPGRPKTNSREPTKH